MGGSGRVERELNKPSAFESHVQAKRGSVRWCHVSFSSFVVIVRFLQVGWSRCISDHLLGNVPRLKDAKDTGAGCWIDNSRCNTMEGWAAIAMVVAVTGGH